jgi:glycogen synthase
MHVLVTADTVGGVWTYTRELVTGLARRGVQVTLVSFGEIPRQAQTEWLADIPVVNFYPTAFRLEWMQEAADDLDASSEYLLRVISDAKPDVLHLSQYAYGSLPVQIPKIVVAHSDVISWWMSVHGCEPPSSPWIEFYRATVARGLSGADMIVAPSRWMLNALFQHYRGSTASRVIYNGRNPGLFNPYTTKEDLILGVGRIWDAGKQLRLLAGSACPWPLVIAGSSENPDRASGGSECRTFARASFRGEQTEAELRHLYARSSIFVGTSLYEPFGLAPLEAALSRCALVLNDIPSFREIWGESAWYFQQNDGADMERAIAKLAVDRQLRLTYANLAYHRAQTLYTAHRMVENYVQLYDALVPERVAAA